MWTKEQPNRTICRTPATDPLLVTPLGTLRLSLEQFHGTQSARLGSSLQSGHITARNCRSTQGKRVRSAARIN